MPPAPRETKLVTISQAKEGLDADDCEADEARGDGRVFRINVEASPERERQRCA
jgi:hypothetical protein